MISSKKLTIISVILVSVVLVSTLCAILLPDELFSGQSNNVKKYSEYHTVTYSSEDYYTDYSSLSYSKIILNKTTATSDSQNVTVSGSNITISGGGTYLISGELNGGSVIVDAPGSGCVRLVFSNAHITAADFAALYIKQADKVVISCEEGTENSLTDAEKYSPDKVSSDSVSAALYSKDDLTINGGGKLAITGKYTDGIKANDTLKIVGATLEISAADDGINVNDYLSVRQSTIAVTSGGDAIKCENTEESSMGFSAFENSDITITSDGDGIYSSSAVYLSDTVTSVTTGGGSGKITDSGEMFPGRSFRGQSKQDTASTKAIKAGTDITVDGGEHTLNSLDDAIHSDGNINIDSATINIECSNDAIHAEKALTLSPETLNITKCYEGIEGGYITINSGDITVIAADDGINAVGENSGGFDMPMTMHKENISDEDIYLRINGGNLFIEVSGDGIDSNGAAVMNGGNIEVYGPENSGNSSIDSQFGLIINGGNIVVAGSSGMAESPSDSSTQNALVFYLDETFDAGSKITLVTTDGSEIINSMSTKQFDFVCISSDKIKTGESYTLYVNDTEIFAAEATDTVTVSGNRRGRMMR